MRISRLVDLFGTGHRAPGECRRSGDWQRKYTCDASGNGTYFYIFLADSGVWLEKAGHVISDPVNSQRYYSD